MCLCVIDDCFHPAMSEFSSATETIWPCETWTTYYLIFNRKSLWPLLYVHHEPSLTALAIISPISPILPPCPEAWALLFLSPALWHLLFFPFKEGKHNAYKTLIFRKTKLYFLTKQVIFFSSKYLVLIYLYQDNLSLPQSQCTGQFCWEERCLVI